MAVGDQANQVERLRRLLPPWFPDNTPVLDAILNGIALVNAFLFNLIAFAQLQTRIRTATGGWLDLIAVDFFGVGGRRYPGQSDASLRNEILINLFRERGTRRAVERVLVDLTGSEPTIFEPARIQDTGAYGRPGRGYGVAGAYGSLLLPYQAFITAFLPAGSGIPSVAGYGTPAGGFGTPSRLEYASLSMVQDAIRDTDVFRAVDGVKPVATTAWVRIGNGYAPPSIVPDFAIIIGGNAIRFSTGHVRVLGWNL